MFDQYRKKYGGLWVGGDLNVFSDRITFSANAINRAIQTGDLTREIMLNTVTKVACRFGWFTGIIDVSHGGDCFTFRCYGSKALTATIEAAVSRLQ
jgi:hypothetical protein